MACGLACKYATKNKHEDTRHICVTSKNLAVDEIGDGEIVFECMSEYMNSILRKSGRLICMLGSNDGIWGV